MCPNWSQLLLKYSKTKIFSNIPVVNIDAYFVCFGNTKYTILYSWLLNENDTDRTLKRSHIKYLYCSITFIFPCTAVLPSADSLTLRSTKPYLFYFYLLIMTENRATLNADFIRTCKSTTFCN